MSLYKPIVMKFNQEVKKAKKTVNYEQGEAYEFLTPQSELYARVGTCLVKEPKFYGDPDKEYERIKALIGACALNEPEFILQLGAYARNVLHLRSIPIVLLGKASLLKESKKFVREYTPSIIKRTDELAEVIAFIESEIGAIGDEKQQTMLPHSLQKGLQTAFQSFNEYGFSKYDKASASVSMRDVIRLVHPKPEKEQEVLYKKIAKDELESADTWEVLISGKGSTKENWETAVKKMPIMALLRNLRNLLDKGVSAEVLNAVVEKLTNEKIIQNSKQFPFRFFSAYKAIEDNVNRTTSKLLTALDTAMFISIKNLPLLDGTTAVFGDNSGSMCSAISARSEVDYIDISSVLSAIASIISPDNVTGVFGQTFARINFSQKESILARTNKIKNKDVGHSTCAYLAFKYLIEHKIKVHRIFLFSDMQCYDDNGDNSVNEQWEEYKAKVNPATYLYTFDLTGYGSTQVPEHDPHVLTIAGWSESILKYVPYFERNRDTVLQEIRAINPATYLNKE